MAFMFMGVFYVFLNIQNLNIEVIKNGFYIVLFSVIGRFIFQWLVDIFATAAGFDIFMDYRLSIGDRLKKAPMGYFSENNLGQIQGVLTTTLGSLENYAMMTVLNLSVAFSMALFMILMLLYFCPPIGFLSLAGMLAGSIVLSQVNKRAGESTKKLERIQEKLIVKTIEFIRGISVLRSFKKSDEGRSMVAEVFEEKNIQDYEQEKELAGILRLYQFVFKLTSCLMVLLSTYLYSIKYLDLNYAAVYMIASFFIYSEMETMGDAAFLSKRVNNQLDMVERITNIPVIEDFKNVFNSENHNIVFEHVYFGYEDEDILKDINIKISDKRSIAIVGPSGSGKTTLCLLIGRFWDVRSGKITIGDKDIRDMSYDSLMDQISMVFQDVYLFNDTVENNIRFGRPNASKNEVINAAKKACCHDFIMSLTDGYQTVVGEGGSMLSGGEKQRISIARAILKDAPIIIFDEATSSIDAENENLLIKAMESLTKEKTVITIAHKLSTIRNADKIIVIENGQIVQVGKHKQLQNVDGVYKRFLEAREKSSKWQLVRKT